VLYAARSGVVAPALLAAGSLISYPAQHPWRRLVEATAQEVDSGVTPTARAAREAYARLQVSRGGQLEPFRSFTSSLTIVTCDLSSRQALGLHIRAYPSMAKFIFICQDAVNRFARAGVV
jgi:hypothetical protein